MCSQQSLLCQIFTAFCGKRQQARMLLPSWHLICLPIHVQPAWWYSDSDHNILCMLHPGMPLSNTLLLDNSPCKEMWFQLVWDTSWFSPSTLLGHHIIQSFNLFWTPADPILQLCWVTCWFRCPTWLGHKLIYSCYFHIQGQAKDRLHNLLWH